MKRKLTVKERKLARELAVGLYWHGEALIEIDPRQPARRYLNTLIHELLHHVCPEASENWVSRAAGTMAKVVWRQGYRRIAK